MSEMKVAPNRVRKIYLSGAISGLPIEQARAIFNKYEQQLKAQYKNIEVINPLAIGLPEEASWGDQMIKVLAGLNESDAIYMIPGWSKSDGALVEFLWAEREGKILLGATEEIHTALAFRVDKFLGAKLEREAIARFKTTVWEELTDVAMWRPWGKDFHREIANTICHIVSGKKGMCLDLLVQANNGDYDLGNSFTLDVTDAIDVERHYNTYKEHYAEKYPEVWDNICEYESMSEDSHHKVQEQMRAAIQYETWDFLSQVHWYAFGSRGPERVFDKALNQLTEPELVSALLSREIDNTLIDFSNYSSIPINKLVEKFVNKTIATGNYPSVERQSNSKYVCDYMASVALNSDAKAVNKHNALKGYSYGLEEEVVKSISLPKKVANKRGRGL